jgi:hypothetical protein
MESMTGAEQYAAQFAALEEEIRATVAGCSEEGWRRACVDEGRTVGVVAHHIASVEGFFGQVLNAVLADQPAPAGFSADDIDPMNAQHAAQFANVGKQETLDLLQTNGAAVAAAIAAFDDAQLERIAGAFAGQELQAAQVIEFGLIGHFQGHLANIRASLAA